MKIRPLSFSIGVLAAAAFFGTGIFAERHWFSNRLAGEAQRAEESSSQQRRFRAITTFQINRPSAATYANSGIWLRQEAAILTSHEILRAVTQRLSLETKWSVAPEEAASRLERLVEAERERGTEIASVSAWSADRFEAVQIANAVREAYEEHRRRREEDAARLQRTLQDKFTLQTSKVEEARLEMMDVMKRTNILDVASLSYGGSAVLKTPEPSRHSAVEEGKKQTEYGKAKYSYESQLELLNSMKEHSPRAVVPTTAPSRKTVELLQEAKLVEPGNSSGEDRHAP